MVSGPAKVVRVRADGSRVPLAFRAPGEMLGETALTGARRPRTATVTALCPSCTAFLPAPRFQRLLAELDLQAALWHSVLLHREEGNLRVQHAALPAERRLPAALVHLASVVGEPTPVPARDGGSPSARGCLLRVHLSQLEIAEFAGLSRTSVHHVYTSLRERGSSAPDASTWSSSTWPPWVPSPRETAPCDGGHSRRVVFTTEHSGGRVGANVVPPGRGEAPHPRRIRGDRPVPHRQERPPAAMPRRARGGHGGVQPHQRPPPAAHRPADPPGAGEVLRPRRHARGVEGGALPPPRRRRLRDGRRTRAPALPHQPLPGGTAAGPGGCPALPGGP